MTIPAIGAISAALPSAAGQPLTGAGTDLNAAPASSGGDFAAMLSKGIGAVQSSQDKADSLAIQAATGDLTDIHDYTIAATQASLVTELATTLRTKGIDAFNQIMGMQA
ncbi:MAG TPA: flagellar hook-basal body complex protein FliE [Jatrophihabitans sp.]|nr:flagellar hook-basal body complex protein FliE [Jatrophihabitans sp.]